MFDYIVKSAYDGVLEKWCRWNDRVKEHPDNIFIKETERGLDQELKQLCAFQDISKEDKEIINIILKKYQF